MIAKVECLSLLISNLAHSSGQLCEEEKGQGEEPGCRALLTKLTPLSQGSLTYALLRNEFYFFMEILTLLSWLRNYLG